MGPVNMEFGPDGHWIPQGAGLQPHLFGYGRSPVPQAVGEALSTGRALAGVGTTALGALEMMKMGMQIPTVITPLTVSRHR